jgi:rod shape determining protein RodA
MLKRIYFILKKFDWILFSSIFLLSIFGLIEIYSIALGKDLADLVNFQKQAFFILIGILALFIFSFIDYHFWINNNKYLYIFGALLLLAVLFFGHTIRGTKGWFGIQNLGIQPVEFIKIILLIFLATVFSVISFKIKPFNLFLKSGIFAGILAILVLLQPDFGSAIIIFLVWLVFIVLAGFRKKYFFVLGIILFVAFLGAWFFGFQTYQKERILTFLNVNNDPLKQSYNINQAIIAIGSGGYMGRGLGFGSQSQLKFLPEAQTDFIFAVIAEELGFLGVLIIFILLGVIFWRLLVQVKKTKSDFAVFLILGSLGLIFIEMFINIGMNIGLLPIVGISLPFLSYGGSSIVSNFILFGIIENIIVNSKKNY